MKALLIQASEVNRVNPEVAQPLGLMYLAAVIRRAGHETPRIVDMRFQEKSISQELEAYKPDVVGVSGFTQDFNLIKEVSREVKTQNPEMPLIIGGPHASAVRERVFDEIPADISVVGEGEDTVLELLDAMENGRDLEGIPGTLARNNGEVITGPPREPINDLESLPFPAWDLIPMEKYSRDPRFVHIRARQDFMSIFTSRSCPYQCIYCHQIFGKGFRARSSESVLSEIRELHDRYGISEIEIWDDVFNLERERAEQILRAIAESPMDLKIAFRNGVRGDRLDAKMLRLMRDAGVYHIAFAIEAGSERMQSVIKKNLNIERTLEAIREAAQLKMFTRGFFMLGFPTETREEIQETINVAVRSDLHLASFFIANPFPNTELYELARSLGKEVDLPYGSYDYNALSTSMCEVSSEELVSLQRRAYREFFRTKMRPYRLLRDLPNRGMLTRHARQLMRRMRIAG